VNRAFLSVDGGRGILPVGGRWFSPLVAAGSPMGGHRISPLFCPDRPVAQGALVIEVCLEAGLKNAEEVMEILEAFDLTGSLRGAAELAGCDPQDGRALGRGQGGGGRRPADRVRARPRVDGFRGEDRGVGRSVARDDPR